MMITTQQFIFGLIFFSFISFCAGAFGPIIYLAAKNQKACRMLDLNNASGRARFFKIKHSFGPGGSKDKRLLNPTGAKGVLTATEKGMLTTRSVSVQDGNFKQIVMEDGYDLLINGMDKLNLDCQRLYEQELAKTTQLESAMSEFIQEIEELKHDLDDAGKKGVDRFVEQYKQTRPVYEKPGGRR